MADIPDMKSIFLTYQEIENAIAAAMERQRTAPETMRVLGLHEGETWVSEDFDDPLPDEFWLGDEHSA